MYLKVWGQETEESKLESKLRFYIRKSWVKVSILESLLESVAFRCL